MTQVSQTQEEISAETHTQPVQAPVIDTVLVARLTKEFEDFDKELKTKVYPIKIENESNLDSLIDFIENQATWKNMEALGIIEVAKVLNVEKTTGIKSGNIYIASLPIQALSFFLSKVEDKGIRNAERHIKFVKPVDEALKLIKLDNDKQNQMNNELAAAENGISVEQTPEK